MLERMQQTYTIDEQTVHLNSLKKQEKSESHLNASFISKV